MAAECWAVGVYKGRYAAIKMNDGVDTGYDSDLDVPKIVAGVDPKHIKSGGGIHGMKNAIPFMSKYVKDFKIHNGPNRYGNEEDVEIFAANTIRLARRVPVAVVIKCPPSYDNWNGRVSNLKKCISSTL